MINFKPKNTRLGEKLWIVLLVPAVLVSLMVASTYSDLKNFKAKEPFIEARGNVAKLDCHNHGQYQVSFSANEQTLTRGSGNLYLRADCRDLAVGQVVAVWYSAQDLNYASFVSPEDAKSKMSSEIWEAIIFGYPFLALFLFIRFKYFAAK